MKRNLIILLAVLLVAWAAYAIFMNDDTDVVLDVDEEVTETIEEVDETETETEVDYIGMTTADAEAKALEDGVAFRIVSVDGELLPATADFVEGRISASTVDGVVTEYTTE